MPDKMVKELREDELRADYSNPVWRLLTIGESGGRDSATWPDYAAELELAREHVAELIR
jgi:hypothetical protein